MDGTAPGRPLAAGRPYRLRALLARHRIPQTVLGEALRLPAPHGGDTPMSRSAVSRVLVHQQWPVLADMAACQARMADVLRRHGVPPAEIETAWDSDDEVTTQATPSSHSHHSASDGNRTAAVELNLPEMEMLTPAAREHFGIPRNPFVDDVHGPADVFLARDQRYIRETLYYASKHAGLVAVVGESGSGKSTLRRDLLDRIRRENEPIVVIQPRLFDKSALTAAHICDAIIADLSTEAPKRSLEAKSRQVERLLINSARTGVSHVMIVEEAHDLTNPALKYLKRFWEVEDGFRRLLGVVMIGQLELLRKLDERTNYDLRELIRRTEIATLRPLDNALEDYLVLKFRRIGADPASVFEAGVYHAIRERLTRRKPGSQQTESHVYPLVVHAVVTKAINTATELGLPKVTAELVGRL